MLQATSTGLPYLSSLERRWQEGCQVGTQLWQELQAQGYPGSLCSGYRALKRVRPADGRRRRPMTPALPRHYAWSLRQSMWLLLRAADDLSVGDRAARTALTTASPAIATGLALAQRSPRRSAGGRV
jgi:hypothetical protein